MRNEPDPTRFAETRSSRSGEAARTEFVAYPAQVRAVMVRDLVVVQPSASLLEAARVMRAHRHSGLPVVFNGTLVGVISELDIRRELDRTAGVGHARGLLDLLLEFDRDEPVSRMRNCLRRLESARVSEVMSSPPIVVDPSIPIAQALRSLRAHGVRRLPVVEDGRLVGIVTESELRDPERPEITLPGPWSRHHHRPTGAA